MSTPPFSLHVPRETLHRLRDDSPRFTNTKLFAVEKSIHQHRLFHTLLDTRSVNALSALSLSHQRVLDQSGVCLQKYLVPWRIYFCRPL